MRPALAALALAAGAVALPALAQFPGAKPDLLPPDRAFRLSARALDPNTVEVRFDIADGYYLYRDRMSFRVEPVMAGVAVLPPGKRKHDAFFGDVDTYRGSVDVRVPLAQAAAPGEALTVYAQSQGCADVGVCYPPNAQQVKVSVPLAGARAGDFVEPPAKGLFN
ncbi:MAG: protein-disulfide reductase DsbD N-terminal domain-containing protein [Proteobacteria bacterium]|nr:protein-disulfide reductase DsbD N-terminal domain-containing protein [Pseudomonadota bacterium]